MMSRRYKSTLGLLAAGLIVASACLGGELKLSAIFADHMVLQQEMKVPVWGVAAPKANVKVTFNGQEKEAAADAEGKWQIKLDELKASATPSAMTVTSGDESQTVKDVLIGEVWLCSGQSNMAWMVGQSANPDEEAASANYPQIRQFYVDPKNLGASSIAWSVCSPQTVKRFTATGYFTGRELHKKLNVPIGLIKSAVGGSRIEPWTPSVAPAMKEAQESAKPKKKKGKKRGKSKHSPGQLYSSMIHPLIPFAIKGVMWYQGEANGRKKSDGEKYRVQLDHMIRSWRKAWKDDFPFYAVQLPNRNTPAQVDPVGQKIAWAMIRESVVYVARHTPDVHTCTIIDIGGDLHPKNKQDVGRRLGSTILNKTYGKGTPTTPFMKSFEIEGDKVVVTFDYTGTGLMAKGGKLKAFAIAGKDKKFVWADAEITARDGVDCVVVHSANVKEPVAVRYAWADNPVECNLYSKEGFPASPFRTDE